MDDFDRYCREQEQNSEPPEHTCPTCHGKGGGVDWEPGEGRVSWKCVDCDGAGVVWDNGEEGEHRYLEVAE